MASTKNKFNKSGKQETNFMNDIMDDIFHPNAPLFQIFKYNTYQKPDLFVLYKPENNTVLDYTISQTDTKLDYGNTQIHYQETEATYVPFDESPPKPRFPKYRKKNKYFSGGPPQWEFWDEKWRRKQEEKQKIYREQLKERMKKAKTGKRKRAKNENKNQGVTMGSAKHRHKHAKPNFMNNIMDDMFHREQPICQIISTNAQPNEDKFKKYRPLRNTCDDYHISQTDTKLDAGDTKIHVQETVAEYVPFLSDPPPPPPPKKVKYFSGGPPKWEFCDEKLLMTRHRYMLALVGPEWYQELSPKQIKTVDNLKNCILKDYTEGVTMHTQNNIAELGLVLRPNHRHVEKALKNCCKCPVEFLLILYQLINPHRKNYSINDRLLLSAVVHLTMTDTLRELHIRIPSPPPPPKMKKKKPKKRKKLQYESPYLEPFTFVRDPPKFTGLYCNKHRQYPEITDREIDEETEYAQMLYEQLVTYRPVCRLLKPSRYQQCINFRIKRQEKIETMELEQRALMYLQDEEDYDGCIEGEECENDECKDASQNCCGKEIEEITSAQIAEVEEAILGEPAPQPYTEELKQEVVSDKEVEKLEDYEKKVEQYEQYQKRKDLIREAVKNKKKFVIGGVVNTANGPIYILSGLLPKFECICQQKARKEAEEKRRLANMPHIPPGRIKYAIGGVRETPQGNVYIINQTLPIDPRECSEVYEQLWEEEHAICLEIYESHMREIQEDLNEMEDNITQLNGKTDDKVEEVILSEHAPQPCPCTEELKQKVVSDKEVKKLETEHTICECKEESRKFVDKPLCQCEKCVEERMKKTTTLVIAGMKERQSEEVIPIIDALIAEQPCSCLEDYEKKVGQYEQYQKRKELFYETVKNKKKFVIGGVVNTADGPIYILSGLLPKLECICHQKAREEAEEKRHLANMPHVPPGRIKYAIGGVRETPQRNVYIINQTLPIDPCECSKVYEQFEEEHAGCLEIYESYMREMQEDLNDMEDNITQLNNETDDIEVEEFPNDVKEEEKSISKEKSGDAKVDELCKCADAGSDPPDEVCKEICDKKVNEKKKLFPNCCCYCGRIKIAECDECVCGKDVEIPCADCTCGPPVVEETTTETEEEEKEERQLKRFFIFKKILCNAEWQMAVIKKALESMAEDGYPLAKLPDCYKLPHFKLWMEMRCGKFWTQQEKYASVLVSDGLDKFYRKVRQNIVNFGREFFPSTFSYPFPFPTFRECYFSYTPSKEEEVLARFVWQKFEYKNMIDAKHC
ncbi:uncharacterized protein BDFB_000789, partial [Asbolus verrucosus]